MIIDKRLINMVPSSKKWIRTTVIFQWIALLAGIISTSSFAFFFQQAYNGLLTLSSATLLVIVLLLALMLRVWAGKKAIRSSCFASSNLKHLLRSMIYQKLSSMPLSQSQQQSTSSVIQIASEGVESIEVYFSRYLPQLFYSLLAPFTLFLFLIFFNAPTAIILLICVPLIPLSIMAVNKIAKRLLSKYWSLYVRLGSSFLDNLQGLVTLKIYQDDDFKAQKMRDEAESFRVITMKVLTMQLNSISVMDLLAYGGAAIGILTALLQFQSGNLSLFGLIVFILLSYEFFIPLRLLGSFFHVAMNGKAASDKIFALLDTPVQENKSVVDFKTKDGIEVEIQQLNFAYSEQKQVIKNLTLTIKPKQLTIFVGKSGCGKSTLVSLLMGFYQAQEGKILFNDQVATTFTRESFCRHVALVSNNSYVFKGTLRENMLMANPTATDDEIYQALNQVNLANFVRENGGLDMILLSLGKNLSGGQIQRLALARALLHDADLYIFDEATSNIDIESEEIILQFIQRLKRNKTIVMISHRLANAMLADQIYVLQQGELIEQGNHSELMASKGIYAEMFNQQKELENLRSGDKNA